MLQEVNEMAQKQAEMAQQKKDDEVARLTSPAKKRKRKEMTEDVRLERKQKLSDKAYEKRQKLAEYDTLLKKYEMALHKIDDLMIIARYFIKGNYEHPEEFEDADAAVEAFENDVYEKFVNMEEEHEDKICGDTEHAATIG